MKNRDHVLNISKFTFDILDFVKHLSFSSYLLVPLHLPRPLTDGKHSKDNKMSSTNPNLNPSNVLDFI